MDLSLAIRYATPKEVDTVADVFRRVVQPLDIYCEKSRAGAIDRHTPNNLSKCISADPTAVAMAYIDSRPVGFAITEDQHGPIWIDWFGVLPDNRGHGIGESLISFLIADRRARRATRLWCDTRTNNKPSIALFEKLQFSRLCELRNHWYGQDYYLWERTL
jgi:ribosomal protein S18 acetylase RimI-like enzyme